MIPAIQLQTVQLGPVTIYVWGLMVALGILVGAKASEWMLRRRGLDPKFVWDALGWIVLGAFIFARLFHVVFYDPATYLARPVEIFAIWHGGLSITGGFLGALLAALWFMRRRRVDLLSYADAMIFGLPLGTFIGRLGCFLTNMHPGVPTDFFLGMLHADGIVRHNLGLYLSFDGLLLFLAFLFMVRRNVRQGSYLVVFLIWYGVVRFGLDFLRAYEGAVVDERYFGLTPAQYGSVLMVAAGIWLLARFRQKKR